MDGDITLDQLAFSKFAVGQPVPRNEDPMLVRGEGRYTDDVKLPGQAYAVFIRSSYAHGVINRIDIDEAAQMPGVLGIYTGPDLTAAGIKNMPLGMAIPTADGSPPHRPACPVLTHDKVRYVGDPIAIVVAESLVQAKDAAEAVYVDVDPLPAVTSCKAAAEPGAPLIHDGVPGNVAAHFHYGDAEQVAAAFAAAAHVTRLEIPSNRIVVCAMEPRSAIAEYDAETDRYTLRVGCQGVFGLKSGIANVLGVDKAKVRVLTGNVGGSFGMKSQVYPEYLALFHAAKTLGRPVKWTDELSESFVSDSHGRDHEMTAELALDAEGHFLAVRLTGYGDLGAYVARGTPIPPTANAVKNLIGVYRTPLIEVSTKIVVTNTPPVGAYRGAGRPEGNYYMERLVDTAAAEIGIDRVELRRRNHISEADMPYKAPNGTTYDSGEFTAVLNEAPPRYGPLPRGHRPAVTGNGRHSPRAERGRHDHHRHARLRARALDAICANPASKARHPVRAYQAAARRQRRVDRRRRHRRVEIADGERRRHSSSERNFDRKGQENRRPYPRSRGRRHRVQPGPLHHCGNRPFDRADGSGRAT